MINVNWHMSPLFWIIYAQKNTLQLLWITYLLDGQRVVLWDDYKILFCYHQNVLQNCWFVICFPFLPLWSLQHKRLTMRTSRFHICLSTHNSTNHATDFYDDTGQLMRWNPNLHIVFADWKRAGNILKEKRYIWLHTSSLMRMAKVCADSKGNFPWVSKLAFKPCLEELRTFCICKALYSHFKELWN